MSRLKNDKAQYEKYLSGKMNPEEANAFERDVLNDPFEQEALEGFESDPTAFSDIEKLQAKVLKQDRGGFAWMRLAAVVALLIVGSFTVWLLMKPMAGDQELAQEMEKVEEQMVEEEPKEKIVASSESKDSESVTDAAEKKVAEGGLEIEEAQSSTEVELEKEESFFEAEVTEVALENNANSADDLQEMEIVEDLKDIDLTDLDEAVAMESSAEDQVQSGAPFAISKGDIPFDTLNSISLSQNLVAHGDELENAPVVEELSVDARLKGRAAARSAQTKEAKVSTDAIALEEVVVTAIGSSKAKKSLQFATSETREITGTITDDAGESLPGVNVVLKGTTTGATSDLDGNFRLAVKPNSTLVISFVGFETQEIEVGNRDHVDITIDGVTELQEVVVTGYGEVSRQATSFTPAKPIGGNKAYKKYLEENLRYPGQAISNQIDGTVTLELTISPVGAISNIDIKKSLGYGCDVEAIRLVNEGPKWSAAEKNGSHVEDKVKVKVKFKR